MKRAGKKGFTVVELLIVIVVIAILATIVMVAYGNVQRDARNATRMTELRSWVDLFEIYKARKGYYPRKNDTSDSGACLGKGFPVSTVDGNARCRGTDPDPGYSYTEAESASLMNEFAAFAKMPPANKTPVNGWISGPWAEFRPVIPVGVPDQPRIDITTAIESRNQGDCTKAGFHAAWDSGNGVILCSIQIEYQSYP